MHCNNGTLFILHSLQFKIENVAAVNFANWPNISERACNGYLLREECALSIMTSLSTALFIVIKEIHISEQKCHLKQMICQLCLHHSLVCWWLTSNTLLIKALRLWGRRLKVHCLVCRRASAINGLLGFVCVAQFCCVCAKILKNFFHCALILKWYIIL